MLRKYLIAPPQHNEEEKIGEDTIWDKIRQLIGRISWKLFLWANRMTAEQYWKEIYEQEKRYMEDQKGVEK